MVAHLFSLVFIGAIAYFIVPGSSLFSWHPFLMSVGYVGCLFQAILVFSKESSLFGSLKHTQKTTMHWIFNTLGLAAILTAYLAIYYNKEEHGKPHLVSWHAKIGIFTIIYTVVQYIAGHNLTVLNFIPKKLGLGYRQLSMYHATSGTFLYVLACVSLSMGIYKTWFSAEDSSFVTWYLCFAFTALLGLIVANQVTAKYVRPKSSAATAAAVQKPATRSSTKTK